jgi:hypothetical protein
MQMMETQQSLCAYCGLDFRACFANWLQMTRDHVIPLSWGKANKISDEWLGDYTSMVLCCSTCNTFNNRYRLPNDESLPTSLQEYYDLRDRIFLIRKAIVLKRRNEAERFFNAEVREFPTGTHLDTGDGD